MGADVNESATFRHTTVLLNEAVEGVLARPDGVYVDGTFGRGGHSRLLLSKLGPQGRLIGIDRDPEAVRAAAAITDPATPGSRYTRTRISFTEVSGGTIWYVYITD